MTRSYHFIGIVGVLSIGLAGTTITAAPDDAPQPAPQVRSESVTIVRLIARATEQSATFRREIAAIHSTNGLVYVHEGHCGRGVLACLMLTVELAGPYRMLRVKLDLRRSEIDTMSALGHELQHAIEALSDPHVTTNRRIFSFFQQLAPTGNDTFETPAAVRVGNDVLDEIRARTTRR